MHSRAAVGEHASIPTAVSTAQARRVCQALTQIVRHNAFKVLHQEGSLCNSAGAVCSLLRAERGCIIPLNMMSSLELQTFFALQRNSAPKPIILVRNTLASLFTGGVKTFLPSVRARAALASC